MCVAKLTLRGANATTRGVFSCHTTSPDSRRELKCESALASRLIVWGCYFCCPIEEMDGDAAYVLVPLVNFGCIGSTASLFGGVAQRLETCPSQIIVCCVHLLIFRDAPTSIISQMNCPESKGHRYYSVT